MAQNKKNKHDNKKPTQSSAKKSAKSSKDSAGKKQNQRNYNASGNIQLTSCLLFALALFLLCVIVIPSGVDEGETNLWQAIKNAFFGFFGLGATAVPFMLIYSSVSIAKDAPKNKFVIRLTGIGTALIMFTSILHIIGNSSDYLKGTPLFEQLSEAWSKGFSFFNSGVIGSFFGGVISGFFGKWGALVTLLIVFFVLVMLLTGITMSSLIEFFGMVFGKISDFVQDKAADREKNRNKESENKKRKPTDYRTPKSEDVFDDEHKNNKGKKTRNRPVVPIDIEADDVEKTDASPEVPTFDPMPVPNFVDISSKSDAMMQDEEDDDLPFDIAETDSVPADIPISKSPITDTNDVIDIINRANNEAEKQSDIRSIIDNDDENQEDEPERVYVLPDVECLALAQSSGDADIKEELTANANKLVETLRSFNIETKIVDIARGPSVTRYEIQPAPGIKISRIANLADDIAMNLAASGVRIEAPIPNKAAVGIEIPNKTRLTVSLREIIDSPQFKSATSKLNVALGKDISGNVTCTDLAKMPHLLIAGTTGSGKSVCLNAMIISILFNSNPEEVKLIMIDPKQVEFTVYRDIPHLMVPVVSDPRKAAGALAWAVSEMTKRYKMFSEKGVRDIKGYNKMAAKDPEMTPMYQIVIFIDELSDLMMVAQNEVEDSICRLAQMARAAGMHLVIATQRPSVNVITGIIKANIPSRIALFVSSQVDSRTIIDTAGAEKLLGNGDMLFNPVGVSKPVRLQGCYVSDEEVERVVDFIKAQGECEYDNAVMEEIEKQAVAEKKKEGYHVDADASPDSGADEETMKAIAVVVENQMASTTLLQRKLKIGYAKAARIMDELEEKGVIGPFEGSKPRKVLMTKQQFNEMRALNDVSGFVGVASDDNEE